MLSPLLSFLGPLPSTTGFLFSFIVDSAHEVQFSPLSPHFLCTSNRFCRVGISLFSFTVGAELSKPFAKYLSVSAKWSCRGTLRLVTSASRPHFAFGKASAAVTLVGHLKCLDCIPLPILSQPSSWSSSCCSVTATPSPLPSLHLLSWHLTALLSAVDLRSLYKNPPRLRPSFWPSLMPLWKTLRRPLSRVASIHRSIMPSGTASSPGIAPVCSSILLLPSSG